MYEYLLSTKLATALVALGLSLITATLCRRPALSVRVMLFNYGPSFAASFFIVGLFYENVRSYLDLISGFLFEFTVLLFYTRLISDIWRDNSTVDTTVIDVWIRNTVIVQAAILLSLVTQDGFGLFSDSSRISFLDNSSANKYIVYLGLIVSVIQIGLLSKRFSESGSFGLMGYVCIMVAIGSSVVSGSKGGVFLWLISVFAITKLHARRVEISYRLVFFGASALIGAVYFAAVLVSQSLSVSLMDFFELAVSRFFLNNDGRALAAELATRNSDLFAFFASSFRGLFGKMGFLAPDQPIGLELYERYFGISTGNGANASLAALIIYYVPAGFSIYFSMLASMLVCCFYLLAAAARKQSRSPLAKISISLLAMLLIQTFSQDFLAFQVLLPFVALLMLWFVAINKIPLFSAGKLKKNEN